MATLNVRDFGAAGDESSNDTAAIQSALDSASDGDRVYFPKGDYLIATGGSRGPILTVPNTVDNLTIEGDPGYGTSRLFISQSEYSSSSRIFPLMRTPLGSRTVTGLEIRNLTVDGNRPSSTATRTQGLQFYPSGAGGGHDILVEDCWVEGCTSSGILSREGGITYNRVTSVGNNQNFGVSARDDDMAGRDGYDIVMRDCVSQNANWVGIDHNQGGKLHIDGLYSENNGRSGLKSTKDNRVTRIDNATFQSEDNFAALRTNISTTSDLPDPPLTFSLNNVAIRDAAGGGMYLSGDDSSVQNSELVGGPIEVRNCVGDYGGSDGGITFHAASGGDIDELRVIGTQSGPGVQYNANHDLNIDTYYHAGNAGGGINTYSAGGNLTVGSQINSDPGRLDTPTESAVGAWSGGTEDSSDSEPESDPDVSVTSLTTTGGVVVANGGALATTPVETTEPAPTSALIEDFESYSAGTSVANTANWTTVGPFDANISVATAGAQGSQSAGITNTYLYNAVQSVGDGLDTYPAADCTIRVATYIEDGFHDIAFAVPTGENNFNQNCYRIRGGPDYSGNPIIRRTVDGSSTPLQTLDRDFPTNTWLEHAIEFEATGSEVHLTYHGYAWADGSWTQFESGTQGTDTDNTFPDERGVGLATYRADSGAVAFDHLWVSDLGDTAAPEWTPADLRL